MALVEVSFPKGVQVQASIGEFDILTDQPLSSGGNNEAPAPYDFFLSSIATCAGFYALRFCQERDIATEGLKLELDIERNPETRTLEKVKMVITTPQGFPEKYKKALIRAAEQCSVKKALSRPPEFETSVI